MRDRVRIPACVFVCAALLVWALGCQARHVREHIDESDPAKPILFVELPKGVSEQDISVYTSAGGYCFVACPLPQPTTEGSDGPATRGH